MYVNQSYKATSFYFDLKECQTSYEFVVEEEILFKGNVVKNTYKQIIEIKKRKPTRTGVLFSVISKPILYDLDNTLKKQQYLIESLSTLTSDLKLLVNQQGQIIKIVNHAFILEKWEIIKERMLELHIGEKAQSYVNGIEKKILNKKKLLEDFRQYRMLGLFFRDILGKKVGISRNISRKQVFKQLISYMDVGILEQNQLLALNDESQLADFSISGTLNIEEKEYSKIQDYFAFYHLGKSLRFDLASYKGKFRLDMKQGILKDLDLNMKVQYGFDYFKTVNYSIKSIK